MKTFSAIQLRRLIRTSVKSRQNNIPVAEYWEKLQQNALSRRRFLEKSLQQAVVLGVGSSALLSACLPKETKKIKEIVLVGAGIAGLTAAYYLRKAGYEVPIYEASNRVGGRMFSLHNAMGEGFSTEMGGEFIDTGHTEMRLLAQELGLTLLDTAADDGVNNDLFFWDNELIGEQKILDALVPFSKQLKKDIALYEANDATFLKQTDHLSLDAYFEQLGMTGWIKDLLLLTYLNEFGIATQQQSALNFIDYVTFDIEKKEFSIYGESDERFKVVGGNQQIPIKLMEQLQSQVQLAHRLIALKKDKGGNYVLTFNMDGTTKEVSAKKVLLAIPFSVLRDVELDVSLGFTKEKQRAIQEMGYGSHTKLVMGFSQRTWRTTQFEGRGCSGNVFSDVGVQLGWDNTRMQPVEGGGYTIFNGGKDAVFMGSSSIQNQVKFYLEKLDQIFPHTSDHYNGKAERFAWAGYGLTKGSYSAPLIGQWTEIFPHLATPQGGIFFAGEHCSLEMQGFMEGAARSGRDAAKEMMEK